MTTTSLPASLDDVTATAARESADFTPRYWLFSLPAVLVIPTVLGWAGIWMMRNGYGPGFVMALYATSVALLSGALVWLTGLRLTTADVRRSEAEEARRVADGALAELETAAGQPRPQRLHSRRRPRPARAAERGRPGGADAPLAG